jgi:hypothetical protein
MDWIGQLLAPMGRMTNTFTRSVRGAAALSLLALTFVCRQGFAQLTSGDLSGLVTDASGGVVAGASVDALDQGTGVKSTQATSAAGTYHFANLPIGSYTVTVTAKGFGTASFKDVSIDLNRQTTQNFTVQVGTTATTVEVTEAAATIDSATATVSTSFDSREAAELPSASSGAGVINLSLLQGGVGTSGSTGSGTGPSIGGTRPFYNNFTVEGIDINDRSVTGPVLTVPNDAVGEFTLIANQFAPDFGHSSGGQFNTTIKSGTNAFHGSAYEYLSNRDLDAADNINAVAGNPLHPRFDDNRFGGDFGGPVLKNKLFFYALYEYEPTGTTASANVAFAPTAAGYSLLNGISGINKTNLAILQQYVGTAPSASPAAATPNGAYPTIGPGNESLGQQVPTAVNLPIGQISTQAPSFTNAERAVASSDYNLSDKDSLRGRFILSRSGSYDTAGFPAVFYQINPSNAYVATLSEYHNFSPSIVNEFRFGYNRLNQIFGVPPISFPGLDQFPNIVLYDLSVEIGPDPNAPQGGVQNTYELTDNLSWTHGKHSMKFGFDGINWISPQIFTQRARGDYEWSNTSDYLFDYYPDYLAQRNVGAREYYGNNQLFGFFANDIWKVNAHLTVNLGLRYEFQTVPLGIRQSNLNIAANVPGLLDFSSPQPTHKNFMPRIGVAYSPGTSGKTVYRAGFGTSYDLIRDNLGLLTTPPEFSSTFDVTGNPGTGFLAHGGISPSSVPANPTVQQLISETSGIMPHVLLRPEVITWNADVQHVFHENLTVDARYVGTHGYHLSVQDQLDRQPVVNASNALPVYLQAPSQATLNSLTSTLTALTASYNAFGDIVPAFHAAGVNGVVTSYQPWGSSSYNGLALEAKYRFTNGLQFIAAYTWSHDLDNSTADVFSTYTTPRRPQDARNLSPDYSSSALDHRERFTYAAVYSLPFFQKSSTNWILKNVVGNWDLAPIYTLQSGTLATAQSGVDANLNGDSAGDRTFINVGGNPLLGSGTTALKNSAGATVAYLANNPGAEYIALSKGALANGGRNTVVLPRINDIDMSLIKKFNITERFKFQIAVRSGNIFNHPQYTGGSLNDVAPTGQTSANVHNALIPSTSTFQQWNQVFSSNPRYAQISAKLTF